MYYILTVNATVEYYIFFTPEKFFKKVIAR